MFEAGDVIPLGPVGCFSVVEWITAIPFDAWPQQKPLRGEMRPAMVNDPDWQEFADNTLSLRAQAMAEFAEYGAPVGSISHSPMLSVVMPGHHIDAHSDPMPADWVCRIHVPLTTCPEAVMVVRGVEHHLDVGMAYAINIRAPHAVFNRGDTPRIHFMFDVRGVS
jgi:hypothetical protein